MKYHPLCAPLPRNVTLRVHTVRAGLQMTDRTLTCSCGRCERVQDVLTLFCSGAAQVVCHALRVVELREQLEVEEEDGDRQEEEEEVERER